MTREVNALFAAASSLMAFAPAQALAKEWPVDFALYDIHIGDSPEKVDQIVSRHGFDVSAKEVQRGPDFKESVLARRGKVNPYYAKGAIKSVTYAKGGDSLLVDYLPWPDGAKVTRVLYTTKIHSDDCDAFKSAYDKRFGHGYNYARRWQDRPVIKQGIAERIAPGTVQTDFRCVAFSTPMVQLRQSDGRQQLNKALNEADGEVTFDF